jgi:putative ABC transport system permease protein
MGWLRRPDPRIKDELGYHRDRLIADYMASGMSRRDAERRAFLEFGSVASTEESVRDVRGRWLEDLARDVRCAVRSLRRNPGFTITAAATLALAIGASTAMFSVLHAVLLRPLPFRAPEQLAMLWTENPAQNLREGRSALSDVDEWRTQSRSFADLATFDAIGATLTSADGAEPVAGASMSPNLLPLLGVQPVLGRGFAAEDADDRQRLVLISHRFWQARFGGARDALGATLVLNGVPSQIIGVLPPEFQIGRLNRDVWLPHASRQSVRGPETWFVVGRLRAGATFEQAHVEMAAIARRLTDRLPATERTRGISVVPLSLEMVGPQSRLALWMLAGAVSFVFLIAAANVASLSLARSVARAREMAVRAALGASAGRIVRQLLTEGALLAAISGLLGTLLAVAGIRVIRAFGPATLPRLNELRLDLRVLGWALALSVLAGLLVGLAPAMATLRRDLRPSGEESGRSVSGGAAARRIRRALVVAEFALAIVLLVGAGLLVRSWWHVTSVDPGFRPERVLMMEVSAPAVLGSPAQRFDLFQRMLEQIQAVPGVERAGILGDLFIANSREQIVTVEGDEGMVSERLRFVGGEASADVFSAMGAPLVGGRFFTIGDGPDAPPVAIVNQAMARRSWGGRDPVGRRFKVGPLDSDRPWYTVVGVVADMRRQGLEREPFPQMFVPLAQSPAPRSVDLFIRTSSDDSLALAGALRAAVRDVEKFAPIAGVAPLDERLGTYLTQRRFQTALLAGFSMVALLMAAIGIYGLIQYSVVTRTQEIGLRQAIGASPGDIFRMVIGEGLMLSLTGLALGLQGAWWLGRAGSSLLFGVTATDPLTFASVSLLLTAVAIAASYVPARRAMAVDPIVALRLM